MVVGGTSTLRGNAIWRYNKFGQTLTTTDATNVTTENVWDSSVPLANRLLSSKNLSTGLMSTTVYDTSRNLPLDSYGPAPASCFGPNQTPNGTCAATAVPRTSTSYDESMQGLAVAWWNNADLAGSPAAHTTGLRDSMYDGTFEKNWGASSGPNALGGRTDHFSLRATGDIYLPSPGTYGFDASYDDGIRLWINDQLVLDSWNAVQATFGTYTVAAGGWNRIRVEYRELTLYAAVQLQWTVPGQRAVIIPGTHLRPAYNLQSRSTTHDGTPGSPSKVELTAYNEGFDPAYGLATSTTEDPGGLNFQSHTKYEPLGGPGTYLRQTDRIQPAGNNYKSAYYGVAEAPDATCSNQPQVPQAGLLKTKTFPSPANRVERYAYDVWGRMTCSRINNEVSRATTYDARGRLASSFNPEPKPGSPYGGRVVNYNYAVGGNPLKTSVSDPVGTITTETDLLGRVVRYTDVYGRPTDYTYDLVGRQIKSSSWGDVRQTDYHSGSGRVTAQRAGADPSAASQPIVAVPTYDAAGRITKVTYPSGAGNSGNGTEMLISYDQNGRTNAHTANKGTTRIASDEVTYSQSGVIVDQKIDNVDPYGAANNFTYDPAGRLTQAYVPGKKLNYNFGPTVCSGSSVVNSGLNSNRTSYSENGVVKATYCYDNADKLISTTDSRYSAPGYDAHGNTTKLGGAAMTYDLADRHLSTTEAGKTVTYVRDATDRIVSRTVDGVTLRHSYSGDGDSPEMIMSTTNTVLDKTVGLLGGVLKTRHVENGVTSDRYSYPNIHGDVMAIADGAGTKQGPTRTYSPFGENLTALVDNLTEDFDYGWLGSKSRGTEHEGSLNVIEMGARQYVPGLGRFIEVDPVEGGSANDYDYCDGDPIGCSDPDGTIGKRWWRQASAFVSRNRHNIINTAVGFAAAAGTVACIASVVCGVGMAAGGAVALAAAGVAAHTASAPARERTRSNVGRWTRQSASATVRGGICGATLGRGCAGAGALGPKAIRSKSKIARPNRFAVRVSSDAMRRLLNKMY